MFSLDFRLDSVVLPQQRMDAPLNSQYLSVINHRGHEEHREKASFYELGILCGQLIYGSGCFCRLRVRNEAQHAKPETQGKHGVE